ncbi:MAG: hypothetical protein LLF78_01635 [Synergistaceae bacterium]|nr:hypothetical protein [Synergistaceae bacterium]
MCVALLLFALMAPSMLTTLKTASEGVPLYLDYRTASARTARAAALLKAPIFYCGYGLPVDGQKYKAAFADQLTEPFSWDGPIGSVSRIYPNSELRIAYAQTGTTKTSSVFKCNSPTGTIPLSRKPEESEIISVSPGSSKPKNIKNWIIFGGTIPPSAPLSVIRIEGSSLKVKSYSVSSFYIPKGDRTHLFRAMKIFCRDGCLYTSDYRTSGEQPRIEGISDMRFDVDMAKREVTVYILSRGNAVYDTPPKIIGSESWPEEYLRPWVEDPSEYQLYASAITWRLPNCIGENILSGKGITE